MFRRYIKVFMLVFILLIPLFFLYHLLKQLQVRIGSLHPDIVLITVDTCRADVLGCYGNPGVYSGAIDELSRRGVLFSRAYASIPTTAPSHTTLFTGMSPGRHRVLRNGMIYRERYETLAERLAASGYHTAAFVSGYSVVARASGLNRGFDVYDDVWSHNRLERQADKTVAAAIRWMSDHPERPFFVWVHLFDPHAPYKPPEPFSEICRQCSGNIVGQPDPKRAEAYRKNVENALHNQDFKVLVKDPLTTTASHPQVEAMWCLYQAEVSFVDHAFRTFLDFLIRRKMMNNTMVVLTSDHGEGFEHDYYFGHGDRLWESAVSVPLIIKYPKGGPEHAMASVVALHQDVLPTILTRTGYPYGMSAGEGFDLTRLVEYHLPRPRSIWFSVAPPLPKRALSEGLLAAAYDPRFKLLLNAGTGEMQLYDLFEDPGEETNVKERYKIAFERLNTALIKYLNESNLPVNIRLTDSEERLKKQLIKLGYVDETFSGDR